MRFKLLITMVDTRRSDAALAAGRAAGATGATVINFARGDDNDPPARFYGWNLSSNRHLLMFVARDDLCRSIMEEICREAEFDVARGTGMIIQLNIEDAVGVRRQMLELADRGPPE